MTNAQSSLPGAEFHAESESGLVCLQNPAQLELRPLKVGQGGAKGVQRGCKGVHFGTGRFQRSPTPFFIIL